MGLITQEVEVILKGKTSKWFEKMGYHIEKHYKYGNWSVPCGLKIKVKSVDLPPYSKTKVIVTCDMCGKENEVCWSAYVKNKNRNGIIYCRDCGTKYIAIEKGIKTKIKTGKSFYDWCYENLSKDEADVIISRWDIDLNGCTSKDVLYTSKGVNKKGYWFKCPNNRHNSELKQISSMTMYFQKHKKLRYLDCCQCGSFAQWGIGKYGNEFLDIYWDYDLNKDINPWSICYGSKKKIWIKCSKGVHKSELCMPNSITTYGILCKQCNSFAQYLINLYGDNALELYWDYDKNTLNPWEISCGCNNDIFIKCQEKDYHDSYKITPHKFKAGNRCSLCNAKNNKVHPKDSLGQYIIDNYGEEFLNSIWSDKNDKTAFEYTIKSHSKIWWKCHEGEHQDFLKAIAPITENEFRCPKCNFSNGENIIEKYMRLKDINYESQITFDSLLGMGGRNLSYDFYLPTHNLLIEYQGEYHDGNGNYYLRQNLAKQQEHDRRKREYAKNNNNFNLLEIWYWDFENIESILDKTLSEIENGTYVNTYAPSVNPNAKKVVND